MGHVVGAIPMGRSLLSPMSWSTLHVESSLGQHRPLVPTRLPHPLPLPACARPRWARTTTEPIYNPLPSTLAVPMIAAAIARPPTVVSATLGFTPTTNAG